MVDFISKLPESVTDNIFRYVTFHEDAVNSMNSCCLVSHSWKDRVDRSHVWVTLGKRREWNIRFSPERSPRSRYLQLCCRLKRLREDLKTGTLSVTESESVTEEMKSKGRVFSYSDGMIATG